MNPIELEWQSYHDKCLMTLVAQPRISLDLAYGVISGVEARGERGSYKTYRIRFNSNTAS